ncbi:MAG: hypothetical protein JNK38_09470 [Acidobacteria bacterium]|nr:hypothetical protein [Acidobacteriota bacterium]
MKKRLRIYFDRCLVAAIFTALMGQWQSIAIVQGTTYVQETNAQLPAVTGLAVYTKWRDETLRNYALGTLTPHYAVTIVAQRLDDSTAQVEILIAAEMKQYTVTIRPVTLNRLPSGETESRAAGNAVTINQKAGDKLGTGSDKIRIGQTTTTVAVSKVVQALEITWTPKNDNKEGFANTCIVRLSKEPEVLVNGYVIGSPVR